MSFLAALQFLTVLPVKHGFTAEQIGRSTGYFPVVGLIIGLVLVLLNYLLGFILPSGVVNVLLIVSLVLLSGALHLDGLVDTCDGLAGHGSAEVRLERMRDSRAGGFGAIGVALLLLVKYVSLNGVNQGSMMLALITAPVVSRWVMVYAVYAFPYARPSGLGKSFKEATGWHQMFMATVIALIVVAGAFRLAGLVILIVAWLVALAAAAYLRNKLGGLTGDTYGALNEMVEVIVFILVSLLAYKQWLV